jgi:hypothetical protein
MANPTVTYTFVNGNVADASQVNQNFTDLINGLTDGTKSLNIDAITAAGKAVLNGAVDLGNAVGDVITVNGSFAGTGGDATATQKGLVSKYDEGTFTPTIVATGTSFGTVTYTIQSGKYTRIGNIINFSLHLAWTNTQNTASGSTTIVLGTLPNFGLNNVSTALVSNIAYGTGVQYCALGLSGTNYYYLQLSSSGGSQTSITALSCSGAASRDIIITGSYLV